MVPEGMVTEMRFRAEFDIPENDCSFCPCFRRESNECATCTLAVTRDEPSYMSSVMVPYHGMYVQAFPIPLDCPLEVAYVGEVAE